MTDTSATPEPPRDNLIGVLATSKKKNERRLPIHPRHLTRIDADLRERMILETGYGLRFGFSDEQLAPLVGRIADRESLLAAADIVL
ncbi:MAG: alanine dehydrogenase, partial [Mycetocola sp.]